MILLLQITCSLAVFRFAQLKILINFSILFLFCAAVSDEVATVLSTLAWSWFAQSFRFHCSVCSVLLYFCESCAALLQLVSHNYYDPASFPARGRKQSGDLPW